jgi:hypothetical protein
MFFQQFPHAYIHVFINRTRIRMDPYQIEMKEPDPHQSYELDPYPDPHQSDKLDQDPHLFANDKPKSRCMKYEPI